ncbi:hypothetical protein AVEN_198514-1 [Araneus ventricosus]|uniref:Uncharacterized protein n=1 Tax=Araneus ventricosus TaxID=182803 RepID=A0A4Y2JA11_ARAVE|nr:hypothetical protein AVEN_198514-1 [Araneus ventricosus]
MNAVSIPGSEELEVLSPSCIEIVQESRSGDYSRVSPCDVTPVRKLYKPEVPKQNNLFGVLFALRVGQLLDAERY